MIICYLGLITGLGQRKLNGPSAHNPAELVCFPNEATTLLIQCSTTNHRHVRYSCPLPQPVKNQQKLASAPLNYSDFQTIPAVRAIAIAAGTSPVPLVYTHLETEQNRYPRFQNFQTIPTAPKLGSACDCNSCCEKIINRTK